MKIDKEYEVKLKISSVLNDNGTYNMVVNIEHEDNQTMFSMCHEKYSLNDGWVRFEDKIGKYITKILKVDVPQWSKHTDGYLIKIFDKEDQ
jgi:hypothetical protein